MVRPGGRRFPSRIKIVDLFCGIGGFRIAAVNVFEKHAIEPICVFSCDIDDFAKKSYFANFEEWPQGDISKVKTTAIPDHDLLFAGFPCQPFSIIGNGKGFNDARGVLFFEILRIIKAKRPKAFILENVKRLAGHNEGRTLQEILKALAGLEYLVDLKILNALDFGLPQKRERVFIVGHTGSALYKWPQGNGERKSLTEILEGKVDKKYFVSERIRNKRHKRHKSAYFPSIWHENKAGNISSYPYSCALRAGASHNYLLVNGERRLTPREMLRLQGFPDSFRIVCSDGQLKKQAGNAVPIPVVERLLENMLPILNPLIKSEENAQTKNRRKGYAALSVK